MLVHPQFDPVALALGPVKIHWYGLTYLVAFGLFYLLASRRVQRHDGRVLGTACSSSEVSAGLVCSKRSQERQELN